MPFRAHFACLLGALFALAVGVSTYQQSSAGAGRSLTWLELPVVRNYYDDDLRKEKEFAHWDAAVMARTRERYAIIGQLRDGRMTLLDAAAEFKRLNHQPNGCKVDAVVYFTGDSDNERICRQVIGWLEANTRELPPSQRQAVIDRLEAELREHRECAGTVVLPGD